MSTHAGWKLTRRTKFGVDQVSTHTTRHEARRHKLLYGGTVSRTTYVIRTPPNLRFDGIGTQQFKSSKEWLAAIKQAIMAEFTDVEWISCLDPAPSLDHLMNTDIVVGVTAGTNEGFRVRMLSTRAARSVREPPETVTLMNIKTLSGIHYAMDICNWLTVSQNRLTGNLHVVSSDPAQGMT